jgi:hypothetical protein
MNAPDLLVALRKEASERAYIDRLEVLDQTASLVKARLYISPALFVQVYRNDSFDTTNLVLIHNGQRVYARDQLGGVWHRHAVTDPSLHNGSVEGRREANLAGFLDEVESVLATMELP